MFTVRICRLKQFNMVYCEIFKYVVNKMKRIFPLYIANVVSVAVVPGMSLSVFDALFLHANQNCSQSIYL